IGLWIVKSIVEKHRGSIRFRSRQGQRPGTVMSLFFPFSEANALSQLEASDREQTRASRPALVPEAQRTVTPVRDPAA
ncbi:MAG: hypothetical protein ACRD2D_08200, partial [Terriglobales bacterium]